MMHLLRDQRQLPWPHGLKWRGLPSEASVLLGHIVLNRHALLLGNGEKRHGMILECQMDQNYLKKIHAQHIRIFCLGTLELFSVFLPSRYIHLEVRNIYRWLQYLRFNGRKGFQTAKFDLPHVLASICLRCLCVFGWVWYLPSVCCFCMGP